MCKGAGMKRFFVCSVSVCFFLFVGAVLADVTMRDIWRWGLVRKTDVLQIGALTNETDLAALRTYHYGSPDIVESPAEWFVFNGAGTITAFNWATGRENVVIPWEIGGVPVTAIGANAFQSSAIVSVIAPQTVTTIGAGAFGYCDSLASVNLPQVTSIGDGAFYGCAMLTAVRMGQNAPAEATEVFCGIDQPPTVYVTNPQATGWGATWNGAPVVRLPLYADAIYQAGELVATTGHVAEAVSDAVMNLNLYAVPIVGGKHELWVKE